jgi:predicted dehydrogenase
MSKKVRIGIVGCGYMGQLAHIYNYAKIADCEIVALAEGRKETAKAVADKYGIAELYSNHREMLDKADIDAVVAIMWYSLHHSVIPDIISAGLPVATEKPMCVKSDTAKRMSDLAKEKGVLYQIGYMKRHDPSAKLARETVLKWKENGDCGKLNYIRATMPPSGDWTYFIEDPINLGDIPQKYDNEYPEAIHEWIPENLRNLYDEFINYYIHQVNLIRYLIGEDYTIDYVDPGLKLIAAKSDSGATCVLEMADYGLKNTWQEYYKICFEHGKIDLQMPAPLARQKAGNVRIYKENGFISSEPETIEPFIPQKWCFFEQAQHFIECVRDGKPTIAPASDAVKDLLVSEQFIKLLISSKNPKQTFW